MEEQNESKFDEKLTSYIDGIWQKFIVFEVTKCCNYSEFVPSYKEGTLSDLHNAVFFHFGFKEMSLMMKKMITREAEGSGDVEEVEYILTIPNDKTMLRDFMRTNSEFFVPVYPLPGKVVYMVHCTSACSSCSALINEQKEEITNIIH